MNVFETITSKIIAVIEAGAATGAISWAGQGDSQVPTNLKTGKPYAGINILMLWATALEHNYTSKYWLTFNQAKELGGHVRKGETSTMGVFWGSREADEEPDTSGGATVTKRSVFAKAFHVFNLDQIEGIAAPDTAGVATEWQPHQAAEALIKASGAKIIEGGSGAFYRPSADEIHLPARERFASEANFYAVTLHELTHWTGHAGRCNRDLTGRFGADAYAMEELVAELGAAFLCAETGVQGRIEGHADYIQSWLKVLKGDQRAIITAASKASQAARYLIDGPVMLEAAA